jgi:very-short-patch-repair endonuclease
VSTNYTSRSRALRRSATDADRKLWHRIRARQLSGHKFRRQVWIGPYIVDFICFEQLVIIEVDGGHHANSASNDAARTAWLNSQGYRVLRFWNNEVLQNIDGVLSRLLSELDQG